MEQEIQLLWNDHLFGDDRCFNSFESFLDANSPFKKKADFDWHSGAWASAALLVKQRRHFHIAVR